MSAMLGVRRGFYLVGLQWRCLLSDGGNISPDHGLWGGCKVAVTIVKASGDDARRELGADHFSETPDDRKKPLHDRRPPTPPEP